VRLGLAPRALRWPAETEPPEAAPEQAADPGEGTERREGEDPLADRIIAAVAAALPPGLLERLAAGSALQRSGERAGRKGEAQRARRSGRPAGPAREGRRDGRLAIVETLKAAAPWQRLRRSEWRRDAEPPPVIVAVQDLRRRSFVRRSRTATIFAVDASGSSALNRLGEAKGAVESLLASCYVRRDEVALIAFRGKAAELLLPPTRSLARARRALAVLPGGGGTPLASAIVLADSVAAATARRGDKPVVVLLTDGQANVALDGAGGRARAAEDMEAAAKRFRLAGHRAIVVDSSPRPAEASRRLAAALGAPCVALPRADGAAIAAAVQRLGA
jgi:magnesium chelatase subunit D